MGMRKSEIAARLTAVAVLSAGAVAFTLAASGPAAAADISVGDVVYEDQPVRVHACGQDVSQIVLFDRKKRPTVVARTPFYTCVTSETLLKGEIPPPPEYCCR